MPDFDPIETELFATLGEPATGQHPSLRLLLALKDQVLPHEIQRRVEIHLNGCRLCAALLRDFITLPEKDMTPAQEQRIFQKLPVAQPEAVVPARSSRWSLLAAVAAVLVMGAGAFIFLRGRAPTQDQTTTAQRTQSAPSTVAELEIPLAPLAPPADASLSLQRRGGTNTEPSLEQLLPAFDRYNERDYTSAEEAFNKLLPSYPHSAIVPLYLGISRLYLSKIEAAYDVLTTARGNSVKATEASAQWYSAIAAQRLGRRPEANAFLDHLCHGPASRYTAESCRITSASK